MSISLISLLLLLCSVSSIRCENEQDQRHIYLMYEKQQRAWYALEQDKVQRIQRAHIDKELLDVPADKMEQVLQHMALRPVKMDNGKYVLHAHGRIKGGGVGGATFGFFAAKFAVHFVCHGVIFIVAACTGPAAPATAAAIEACALPFIESASNLAGLAGGIAGGVVTGPV